MRNNDEIVAYVDNLRKSQNMSLNELARATGLAKSSLSRYFNKSRDFPVNKVHLFAKALHTSSEDILGFKPVHYPTSSTDYQSVQADKSTYVVKHDYPSIQDIFLMRQPLYFTWKFLLTARLHQRIFRSRMCPFLEAPSPSPVVFWRTARPLSSFSISERFTR